MDKGRDVLKRAIQNSRGTGMALGALVAAGAGLYGITQSIFTGLHYLFQLI